MDTSCCIVGAGPAGMLLALLLARRGVPVTLLEAQKGFDREFRGDTLHPAILELLDQIGLADGLHQLPRMKRLGPSLVTAEGTVPLMDFTRLGGSALTLASGDGDRPTGPAVRRRAGGWRNEGPGCGNYGVKCGLSRRRAR